MFNIRRVNTAQRFYVHGLPTRKTEKEEPETTAVGPKYPLLLLNIAA